jgi:glycylpeptide N-tetradecanoyltransferase
VAYLYYYASDIVQNEFCDQDGSLRSRLDELIGDALVIAQGAQFDVFNALTQEDNCQFLDDLGVSGDAHSLNFVVCPYNVQFSPGDGLLHFYLYNWRTAPLTGLQPIGSQGPGVGVGTVLV